MSDTTLNAGDVGRLTKATAAIIPADYVLLQRSATGHLRRATVSQLGAGFQGIATTSNVTVTGVLSVTGVSTLAGGMNTTVENVTNLNPVATTAVTAVTNNGMTVISSTAINNVMVLAAPVVGGFKWIRTSTTFAHILTCSLANINSTYTTVTFGGMDQSIILRGEGSTQWGLYAMVAGKAGTSAVPTIA